MGVWPVVGPKAPVMISTLSGYGTGIDIAARAGATVTSSAFPANRAHIAPIYIPEGFVASKLCWITGTAPTGSIDVGIYDASYNRMVSSGAIALSSASIAHEYDMTDMALHRGVYYLAMAFSANGAAVVMATPVSTKSLAALVGFAIQDTAYPLPATLTPVIWDTALSLAMPFIGVSQRALVV